MPLFKKSAKPDVSVSSQPEPAPVNERVLKEGPLYARWYILHRLEEEMERARRYDRPVAVIMVATAPPIPGEARNAPALEAAVETAQAMARSIDLLGWYSGDSFLTIMPETTQADAEAAVSRWRNEMWLRSRAFGGQKWRVAALASSDQFASAEQFAQAVKEHLAVQEAA
jgi:GGDEF domain-containing protein